MNRERIYVNDQREKNPPSTKPDLSWSETIIPDKPAVQCNHYFEFVSGTTVECRNCHLGLVGVYDLKEGKPIV